MRDILSEKAIVVVQSTSPFFAPKSFWCVNKTIQSEFKTVFPYHVYLPSFGEWGFCLTTNFNFESKVFRSLPNLKFYDYSFQNYTQFSKDMTATDVEINRLNNQKLVSYFNQEWGSY